MERRRVTRRSALKLAVGAAGVAATPALLSGRGSAVSTEIQLEGGAWNLIGATEEVEIAAMESESGVTLLPYQEETVWRYVDGGWTHPTTLQSGEAAFVYPDSNGTYTTEETVPAPVLLYGGRWNMIATATPVGSNELSAAGVRDSLAEYQGELFWNYGGSGWQNPQETVPGEGYYVYSQADVPFVPAEWYREVRNHVEDLREPFESDSYTGGTGFADTIRGGLFGPLFGGARRLYDGSENERSQSVSFLQILLTETARAFESAPSTIETQTYRNGWTAVSDNEGLGTLYDQLSNSSGGVPSQPVKTLFDAAVTSLENVAGTTTASVRQDELQSARDQVSTIIDIVTTAWLIDDEDASFESEGTKLALNADVALLYEMLKNVRWVIEENLTAY